MQPLTIARVVLTPFHLPLIRPFQFAGNTFQVRVGFYLDVTTQEGITARGEIAPLEGISNETLKAAKHDADSFIQQVHGLKFPNDKDELISLLRGLEILKQMCSSSRFGIESTLVTLAANVSQKTLVNYLGGDKEPNNSAYLLQGSHEQVVADAKDAYQAGERLFKLKVGSRNIPLDVKNVQALRELGKDVVLRLDANRVWSMDEALLFSGCVGSRQIEYIEEPLSSVERLAEFYEATHLPIALDETLKVLRLRVRAPGRCMPTLANFEGVKAYIIKPVVIGGLVSALDWIEEARENGKKAVISSCFETPVGFNVVAALASLSEVAPGLGTQRFYA